MLNIAIVDDLHSDRERLKRDIQAYFAASGACAVCKAFSDANGLLRESIGAFQIAFLDICMEGLDGIELARRLRRACSSCSCPPAGSTPSTPSRSTPSTT